MTCGRGRRRGDWLWGRGALGGGGQEGGNEDNCNRINNLKKKERKTKNREQPGLVWLSGLSAGLRTKGSPV